jgi:competence protein ComEA
MAKGPREKRSMFSRVFSRGARAATVPGKRPPLLTRGDQVAVFALVVLGLAFTTTRWLISAGWSGGLVDVDAAEPLKASFRIDINAAQWTELAQLPDIGEALAKRIIETREREGPFRSHEDLDRVPGIGSKTLDRIRPLLRPIE